MLNKQRIKISEIIKDSFEPQTATVYGWIKTVRNSKNLFFIELNDGSCFESLQLVVDAVSVEATIKEGDLLTGACLKAVGAIVQSPAVGQKKEMQVKDLSVVGPSDAEYPMQKKKHTMEFLRSYPHLRPKTNTFYAVFKMRSRLAAAIHDYFQSKDFVYLHSPIITVNDCEGGSEAFQVTNLNLAELKNKDLDYTNDFFKQPAFLTVSGQLEAEPFALSHNAVYTFGPTFRADPSDTPRHAAEFWMMEPEMAFYDFEDLLDLIEDFVKSVTLQVQKSCPTEIEFFQKYIEPDLQQRYAAILDGPFQRVDFAEVIEILKKSGQKFENQPEWGEDLFIEHERYLVDEYFKKPVLVTNYPENFKSFYMRLNDDGRSVACVDLLLPGIGEVVGGSQREERYEYLKKRMAQKKMDPKLYEWYLETRRWGSAPHSGFGLGFERLLMYLTGMKNVKDVIPYPRAARKIY